MIGYAVERDDPPGTSPVSTVPHHGLYPNPEKAPKIGVFRDREHSSHIELPMMKVK